MESVFLYPLLGLVAGVLAGLLGIGGGLIIVPALLFIFSLEEIPPDIIPHIAVATSLATVALTSLVAAYHHHLKHAVQWRLCLLLAPGLVLGAFAGAQVAHAMPGPLLKTCFGVYALLAAVQIGFRFEPVSTRVLPRAPGLIGVGGVIGFISSIVGIGGGTMTVPFLTACNVPLRRAIATSAVCGFSIAIGGVFGFMLAGSGATSIPALSGYVYWPAVLGIVAGSLVAVPLGVWLAHSLPVMIILRLFALVLAVVGIRLILS